MNKTPEIFTKWPGYSDNFNDLPFRQDIEPYPLERFLALMHSYGSLPSQLRQVVNPAGLPDALRGSVMVWYCHIYGDCFVLYMGYDYKAKGIGQYPIYRAGCKHEYINVVNTMRGWHQGQCKKCGFKYEYDSGD